ncbi:unnamed protein product [Cyclocybe aegerita]|uniref:PPM-type phosphatase domain-containing protein n=1 Tax=Cyclocybe aegerita TaxID=1973307 RepID=A0A8S0VXM4_CYCAE|nr:unnamed protein product [Cyclocybe aegerita]
MLRQLRNTRFLFSKTRRHVLISVGVVTASGVFAAHGSRPIYGDAGRDEEKDKSKAKSAVNSSVIRELLFSNFKSQVEGRLSFNGEVAATSVETHNGTSRVDAAVLPSNNPCEDAMVGGHVPFSPTLGFTFVGIYDGHNGPDMATGLEQHLSDLVVTKLADLYSQHAKLPSSHGSLADRKPGEPPDPVPPGEEIDEAIKQAFCEFDDLCVHGTAQAVLGLDTEGYRALSGGIAAPMFDGKFKEPMTRSEALSLLRNAYSGSCAIMGLYNTSDRSLRVALTGDSRAVLGRRVEATKGAKPVYETHILTADQNASNPSEAARLSALHPDEPELLKNKRVLGWGPARAFGNGSMKWSIEIQRMIHEKFLGDRPRESVCKTPPYFTAEPVITTFKGVRKGDFAVFASDGLWDCLGNEEVVGLIGEWLEKNGIKEKVDGHEVMLPPKLPQSMEVSLSDGALQASFFRNGKKSTVDTFLPSELPVTYPKDYKDTTAMYRYWRTEKKFICAPEDGDNVAVHLVRNAVGGADRDLSEALLKIKGARSRRFRDDISIAIVFFD